MTRCARTYCESGIYHVMFRGINKQDVFLNKRDYLKLLEIIIKIKEKKQFELYAYCLMSNHVHLVIKEKELRDISDIMKRIIGEYTQWFNYKYERTGGLMENRYRSQNVETDEYFMHLVRYVHQNPVKAGLVSNIADYQWSSYSNYLEEQGFISTELLFEVLPKNSYEYFHKEIENGEFALYHDEKFSDEDLIRVLNDMGIENPQSLQYCSPDKLKATIEEIKRRGKFSQRCISRVTGVPRNRFA